MSNLVRNWIVALVQGVSGGMVAFFVLMLLDEQYRIRVPALFEFDGASVVSAVVGALVFSVLLFQSDARDLSVNGNAADSPMPKFSALSLFCSGMVLVLTSEHMSAWLVAGYLLILSGSIWLAVVFVRQRK